MFPKLLFLLMPLLLSVHTIFENSKFYHTELSTLLDCRRFGKSYFVVARTKAYFNVDRQEFYLNEDRQTDSLIKCAEDLKHKFVFKSLIYHVMDLNFSNLTAGVLGGINLVQYDTPKNVELIAHLFMFAGPGGQLHEVVHGLHTEKLQTHFVYAAAETESRRFGYSQELFNSFALIKVNPAYEMYIELNGWHLRNMGQAAWLPQFNHSSFAGFIVYVSRESSRRISTHDATKFLPDTRARKILDMKNSPEFIDNGQRPLTAAYYVIALINLINVVYLFLLCRLSWNETHRVVAEGDVVAQVVAMANDGQRFDGLDKVPAQRRGKLQLLFNCIQVFLGHGKLGAAQHE